MDWSLMFSSHLVQNMLLCTVICCVLCGVVGTYVVAKRMVFVTGGIAHTTFGGVGMAYWIQSVFLVSWFAPMLGAAIFAIASAAIMALPPVRKKLRDDSVIGVLWSVGMAMGVIFMHFIDRTVLPNPASFEDILFGSPAFITYSDIAVIAVVASVILVIVALLYRDMQLVVFDEVQAKISGINVNAMIFLLYLMVAVTCVLVTELIGIVMIIALVTIPPAVANMFCDDIKEVMTGAVSISVGFSLLAMITAIVFDLPPGATVAVILGTVFIVSTVIAKAVRKTKKDKSETAQM
ncbi:MAG: metal ABC transporter permease [Candidatus Methanomethylophilaceae archaeon]|jgi:zinc transport system permease protein